MDSLCEWYRWVSQSAVTCITPEGSGTGKGGNVVVADIAGFRLQPSWPRRAAACCTKVWRRRRALRRHI
jgi:hypothetical protein